MKQLLPKHQICVCPPLVRQESLSHPIPPPHFPPKPENPLLLLNTKSCYFYPDHDQGVRYFWCLNSRLFLWEGEREGKRQKHWGKMRGMFLWEQSFPLLTLSQTSVCK